jgi:hypothetical protein
VDPFLEDELSRVEEDMEMGILRSRSGSGRGGRGSSSSDKDVGEALRSAVVKAAKEGLNVDPEKGLSGDQERFLESCRLRVVTLKAYLDEAERDLVARNWANLQVYLYTFAEQEDAFVGLINGLYVMCSTLLPSFFSCCL